MEIMRRSFRLERGSSLKLGRSSSSKLASEIVSSEISRNSGYDYKRLSESMRLTEGDERCDWHHHRRRKNRAWSILTKVFTFGKIGSGGDVIGRRAAAESLPKTVATAAAAAAAAEEEEKKKKIKRRSMRVPDPYRRWPVQGW